MALFPSEIYERIIKKLVVDCSDRFKHYGIKEINRTCKLFQILLKNVMEDTNLKVFYICVSPSKFQYCYIDSPHSILLNCQHRSLYYCNLNLQHVIHGKSPYFRNHFVQDLNTTELYYLYLYFYENRNSFNSFKKTRALMPLNDKHEEFYMLYRNLVSILKFE